MSESGGEDLSMVNANGEMKMKTMQAVKPPLGLRPKEYNDGDRRDEIGEAISRYVAHGKKIPLIWIEEYNNIAV